MQPVSFGGFPMEPLPVATPAAGPASASDVVDLAGAPPRLSETPAAPPAAFPDPAALQAPRPWPRPIQDLPRASVWPVLSARGPAEATAGLLSSGAVGAALLPFLEEHARRAPHQPRGPWDGRATPHGWRLPRNPGRVPVRPRCPFEICEGTDDLGPLHIVSTMVGRIRALRLQWPEETLEPAYSAQKTVFHDVLTRLAPDVTLHVVAEGLSAAAVRVLLAEWRVPAPDRVHLHPLHLHSTPEELYLPLTMWARDGAVLMRTEDARDVLLLPRSFRGDTQVSPSLNRRVVQGAGAAPARLAAVLPDLIVRRSALTFEGGDLIASRRAVLLGGASLASSMAALRLPRDAVVERFTRALGRDVIVIEPQPDFHLDLGFTFLDDDTVAVADPREAERMAAGIPELEPMVAITRDHGLAEKYDGAATALRKLGYQVARVPNLAGLGLTTPYLTYNNVLMENFVDAGGPIKRVFMPVYGVPTLDEAARTLYRQHGYTVIDMPSARFSTRLWGAIRCATGELQVSD